MMTKDRVQKIVDDFSPNFKKLLKIRSKIVWHIYHSKDDKNKLLKYGFPLRGAIAAVAPADRNTRKFHIVIYYNKINSRVEVMSTIIHELLHVKIRPIILETDHNKIYKLEESFIKSVEKLFYTLLLHL